MAEFNPDSILPLVKVRLGIRVNTLDDHLKTRINAAYAKITDQWGIKYDSAKADHVEVLADYTCWLYGNRDSGQQSSLASSGMPDWLRLEIRELYLHNHAQGVT